MFLPPAQDPTAVTHLAIRAGETECGHDLALAATTTPRLSDVTCALCVFYVALESDFSSAVHLRRLDLFYCRLWGGANSHRLNEVTCLPCLLSIQLSPLRSGSLTRQRLI